MQMQQFNLHFLSPSSDLGKSLSTTSTKLVLDMTRMCPFIFQTTQSPSDFKVPDSCMTVHLQLFQILFHNNNRLRNANTVIELAIWKITVLIFIHASTVVDTLILQTDASDTSLLQEPRFILDGSLLGNGHQQPRRCLRHMLELVHEYWANLQLSFRHHLTLSLTGGKMVVMYKLRWQIKRAWATISHSMFKVVANSSSEPEPQFVIPDSEM